MLPDDAVVSSDLLLGLFQPGIVAMETRVAGDTSDLSPLEAGHIGQAVPKRAREFAAGRLCARRALERLDHPGWDLLVAPDRTPIWPQGIAGSISHTTGFCGAVAGPRRIFSAIGFDVEIASRVSPELYGQFCTADELKSLSDLPRSAADLRATMLFSAKEAFYKCQYPLTAEWLEFQDISVGFTADTPKTGSFSISPCRTLALEARHRPRWNGRFALSGQFVVTGVALLAAEYRSNIAVDQDPGPDDRAPA